METIKVSLYLEPYVIEVLKAFGNSLDEVVNRILDVTKETVDIASLPVAEKLNNTCRRVEVVITEPTYLSYVEVMGRNSKKLSLRRLLYWFVNNEQYVEYGFEPVGGPDKRLERYCIKLSECIKTINKVEQHYGKSELCDTIRQGIRKLLEELQ